MNAVEMWWVFQEKSYITCMSFDSNLYKQKALKPEQHVWLLLPLREGPGVE